MKIAHPGRLLTLLALFVGTMLFAQQQPKYSKIKLYADDADLQRLAELGVCADHGMHKHGVFTINDFSEQDLAIIEAEGYQYEVLIDDIIAHYHKIQAHPELVDNPFEKGGQPCDNGNGSGGAVTYPTPSNWALGSMGGFHTLSEIEAHLDAMAAAYPNLITVKAPISNFSTVEGNNIWWVRVSDNPTVDENEPELLYTSLIHAREPLAGAQTIYYLWYLLENYATDPEVQYLVDNTEMYFVPVINPDGYEYNEQIAPNGGGLWRKNRRNWGGGDYGTDLNRNFSYQWGTTGISNNPGSDVYCGPNPFSEVETQAIKWLCENRDFELAMNYHSHGGYLLFPFGYQSVQSPDYDYQLLMTDYMIPQGYTNFLSADLYPASGDSDDWMYADDLATKPKIFANTPEVEGGDFWFSSTLIEGYCNKLVYQNLQAAWVVTRYAEATDLTGNSISTVSSDFDYEIQRIGLMDGGTYTVSLSPVSSNITSVGNNVAHTLANPMDTDNGTISIDLDPGTQSGESVVFALNVDNGLYTISDTIYKTYGGQGQTQGSVIFADNGDNDNNWNGGWGVSNSVFLSANGSLHDSPGGNYNNNDVNNMQLDQSIDLTTATSATLKFWALWEIEQGWDYCQIQASTNGGSSWAPLCGVYTVTGNGNQDTGNPLWDGFQTSWVQESIDLNDYLGQVVDIRFSMVSDQAVREDGFYVDDLELIVAMPDGIGEAVGNGLKLGQNMPNPAADYTMINYVLPQGVQNAELVIYNAVGQEMDRMPLNVHDEYINVNTSDLAEGVYLYNITTPTYQSQAFRMTVVR